MIYDLGVIGGMGPLAACEFCVRLVKYTKSNSDQKHVKVCLMNNTGIQDRTDAIINQSTSIILELKETINQLAEVGVRNIVMPCNTAHYFLDNLVFPKSTRFINMVDETLKYVNKNYLMHEICILGTEGTRLSRVYSDNKHIITSPFFPSLRHQKLLSNVIYDIKKGKDLLEATRTLEIILDYLNQKKGDVVFVLACTELSLLSDYISEKYLFVDSMDILAKSSVQYCGYELA